MFDNIGGKIKTMAKVVCWLGIITSITLGVLLVPNSNAMMGLVVMIGGSVLSWIGSFMTYGFGQLVENSEIIKENCVKMKNEKEV